MKTIFIVQKEEAEKARDIEKLLISLSEESGILFVSVSVVKNHAEGEPRKVRYRIVVGCSRIRDVELIALLVRSRLGRRDSVVHSYLGFEPQEEFTVDVFRGINRSCIST